MIHVGNDIVDLLSPYVIGKSGNRKFVQRVLTAEEQNTVLNSATPDKLLQVYWAAKETAYKTIAKTWPGVSSAPRKYQVFLHRAENGREVKGWVKTPRSVVFITAHLQTECIHCVGVTSFPAKRNMVAGFEQLNNRISPDFAGSSAAVSRLTRALAKKKIAAYLSIPENNIRIAKTDGEKATSFPRIYIDTQQTDISVSLSHDGRFIAFALVFQPVVSN